MKQVKFFNTGKWAEHKPHLPQFEVKEGQVLNIPDDVSPETAASAVHANRAVYLEPDHDAEKEAAEKAEKEAAEKAEKEALELSKSLGKNKGKKNR